MLNRSQEERAMRWQLNKHQAQNLEILKTYMKVNAEKFHQLDPEQIKKDMAAHGWDIAVVELALEDLKIGKIIT